MSACTRSSTHVLTPQPDKEFGPGRVQRLIADQRIIESELQDMGIIEGLVQVQQGLQALTKASEPTVISRFLRAHEVASHHIIQSKAAAVVAQGAICKSGRKLYGSDVGCAKRRWII